MRKLSACATITPRKRIRVSGEGLGTGLEYYNYQRAIIEARRIANLHWFAHARVELKTTYAAPVIAERLSARQLILRRISEIVCMYVCIRHA